MSGATTTFKAFKLIAIQATESIYTKQKPFSYSMIIVKKVPALDRQRSVNLTVQLSSMASSYITSCVDTCMNTTGQLKS